ncbi:MAG TPA: DUF1553 domain-containing protein [Gemmataceae bacterium]|jgi:hypothetical protein|nr:DUF1553 domain-containing protein [Gemmataceae bacterium]
MMHSTRAWTCGPAAAVLAALALCGTPARAADRLQFNRDIRPILAENCFLCHGPDKGSRKAKLRLDDRTEAVKRGAIVPGNPDKSMLVERIFSADPHHRMPPAKVHKKLTAAQKQALRRWITDGAEYQLHWAFIAPRRPRPPVVKDSAWARNPIDQFILSQLEQHGLRPAPEADRRTLARRVSLDLTGLPPVPADVEAFVRDPAPDAYERFVGKLLASPYWGEHRGRFWLDAARYADSNGIHFDNYREIWTYRDWVINAFNHNMPFDRFTVEQLAGDLLPRRTLDQQIASGFNRCNITTNEGGAIAEEYLVLYTRDRTETVSKVWLGLTANCAVCHDHKFDPLSQREFYAMSAFFNNTIQAAMDGNIKDTPPVVRVTRPEDRPRWDALVKELAEIGKQAEAREQAMRTPFAQWLAGAKAGEVAALAPADALRFHAALSEGTGNTVSLTVDGKASPLKLASTVTWDTGHVAAKAFKNRPGAVLEAASVGDFDKDQAFSYGAWVKLPANNTSGAVFARMDDQHDYRGWDLWVENGRVGAHIIHKWPEDGLKVLTRTPMEPGRWNHVFVTYDGSGKAAGVKVHVNGTSQPTEVAADALKNSIRTQVPMKVGQRHSASRIDDVAIQDVRVYGRLLSGQEVDRLTRATRAAWLVGKPAEQRSTAERVELFNWWLPEHDAQSRSLADKLNALRQEEAAIKSRATVAHVMQERAARPMAHVLFRGAYDKPRARVKPGTPHILPPMSPDQPQNRLGFARWLVRPEHPLTARVTVNRFWQEVFGAGIVKTTEDFGISGELPSHTELLDWLAVEFRESGWDVKRFFKLLVTSAAYRQSAATTADKLEKDPQDRLLSRGPRFRVDAEVIRDYALAASGLLARKIGGPSVKPYQPDGVWEAVAMIGSDTRDYRRDNGLSLYRRSLYTFWKRAAPPASMDIFNAPTRETCTVRRDRTNTPLQALVTLNDPQFVEAARHLGQTTLAEGGKEVDGRIDFMARRLLARPFRARERKVVRATLDDLLGYYKAHPDDAKKLIAVGESESDPALDVPTLAAWTMLANQLMNLDEVLNK